MIEFGQVYLDLQVFRKCLLKKNYKYVLHLQTK